MPKFRYILIGVIMIMLVFGPLGAKFAHADFIKDIAGSAIKTVVAVIGNIILTLISKILTIAGFLFNASIEYSIVNFASQANNIVSEGWTVCRDVANLFFIFILLYIAIATILQLSGYGMKELLVKVIIIALLVNFSLMITKVIIDASNILAMEFYDKVTQIKVVKSGTGEEIKKAGPSDAIMAGINPQSLFDITPKKCLEWNEDKTCKTPDPSNDSVIFKTGDKEATLVEIFIITIMGSILFLVLAFVFLSAAVLFIIRTAVLWILMILAPLAFLAMALPKTQQYANKWWDTLFHQAFFAPIYLFLIYLVIKIISSGSILKDVSAGNASLGTAILNPGSGNISLIMKFIVIIVLSLATLIIAKQAGAYGSGAMMKMGQQARKWGQSQAGRISRRGAGYVAEQALKQAQKDPEGKFAQTLRVIPLATRGLAKASSWREKQLKETATKRAKAYGSYSEAGLKEMLRGSEHGVEGALVLSEMVKGPILTRDKRVAVQKALDKKVAEETKKKNIEKENARHKELREIKIPEAEKQIEIDNNEISRIETEIKFVINPYEKSSKEAEVIVRKEKLRENKENLKILQQEFNRLEDKTERRKELGELEEKIKGVEGRVEGGAKKTEKAEEAGVKTETEKT